MLNLQERGGEASEDLSSTPGVDVRYCLGAAERGVVGRGRVAGGADGDEGGGAATPEEAL